ncbi:MAG: AAA family ATPase [Pseudomonadota bacterium]
MSYLDFYGLEQEPFSNAPVSRFYFNSNQHAEAIVRLERVARQMKGLAVLVGDIGTGKTTLARRLLDNLPESEFEAALLVIIHSGITADWLLRRIAQQLGIRKPGDDKLQLLSQLYRRLLQIADAGKKAVVLIDEAQMLQTEDLMEEFRGLLNLEIPDQKLITFIFFGLPEIEDYLKLDPPLLQRVALKYHLDAFDAPSCRDYIAHRMRLAGAQRQIFLPTAAEAIHRYSRGIPRLINTIADNALFEGFILKATTIGPEIVENISIDLGLTITKMKDPRQIDSFEIEPGQAQEESLPHIFGESPEENTAEHTFERSEADRTDDIDSILAGLEEKV